SFSHLILSLLSNFLLLLLLHTTHHHFYGSNSTSNITKKVSSTSNSTPKKKNLSKMKHEAIQKKPEEKLEKMSPPFRRKWYLYTYVQKKEIFRDKSRRFIQRRQSLLRIHQRCTC
ncbi:hypothetical protein LINPERHAP1_LOCUS25303, partial [Linum perenne]